MFTIILATDSLIVPHGHNFWPLTDSLLCILDQRLDILTRVYLLQILHTNAGITVTQKQNKDKYWNITKK
jgi:hypothetical protein